MDSVSEQLYVGCRHYLLTQAENIKNSKHMGFLKANNITRGCSLNHVDKAGGGGSVRQMSTLLNKSM